MSRIVFISTPMRISKSVTCEIISDFLFFLGEGEGEGEGKAYICILAFLVGKPHTYIGGSQTLT